MALPFVAAGLIGGIVTALTQFFATRIGVALAAAGLTLIAVKGLETLIGYVITDVQTIVTWLQAFPAGSGVPGLGAFVVKLLAFAGFWDGLNILLAGYLAVASLAALKVGLARLTA